MMAFNPSPQVASARAIAAKFYKTRVIVLMIDDNAGTLEYASYGENAQSCKTAPKLADVAFEAVQRACTGKDEG